jgi:two-component system, OmpR family, alkaline phosphatase synthesis response regulator PhoP
MKEETSRKRVLIVDDEPGVRSVLQRTLARDYDVLEASNGEVAVDMARRNRPDIILMDVMMPKADGYSACWTIKQDEVTKAIPVVMVTALGYELNRRLAQQTGAAAYITKPFDKQALLDTVAHILKNGSQETLPGTVF